jgi:hypothetical protein
MEKSTRHIDDEPNPPLWSKSVIIFRPTDDMNWIQQQLYTTQDPVYCDSNLNDNNDADVDNTTTTTTKNTNPSSLFTCDLHFSRRRIALLFAPGIYTNIQVEIGYYVQLLGLGYSAREVCFVYDDNQAQNDDDRNGLPKFIGPFVPALNKHIILSNGTPRIGTSLDTFWRGAENFMITSNLYDKADMMWATSQASPLRRIHVTGDLYLHDGCAYASGGHFANSLVKGTIHAGGQQQYLIRNVQMNHATGGAWSMVYVGCTGNVPDTIALANDYEAELVVTVLPVPRVRIEKPYIVMKNINGNEKFELRVPKAIWNDNNAYTIEPLLDISDDDLIYDFNHVRVVRDDEPISRIQDALDEGKHVVLCPGIFFLEDTISICHSNQILLGLGLATLVAPRDGSPCIYVAHNVPGVRLAGLMLEATKIDPDTMLKDAETKASAILVWGEEGPLDSSDGIGCRENPSAMWDIYIRVGGTGTLQYTPTDRTKIAVDTMMHIHSNFVIGDNIWLWRADHDALNCNEVCNYPNISRNFWQTESIEYRVRTGLNVTGNDVTIYGLAVEHANYCQTLWSGERGAVYFYQSELPYDVIKHHRVYGNESTGAINTPNVCGFRILPNVQQHDLLAPGVYSNFRNEEVFVLNGIEYPENSNVNITNPFIVKLDNHGGIKSVANNQGGGTGKIGIPVREYKGER